ncbi:MAG TPA: hypothetical protein VKP30_31285 [Polyangiaceae bacterium]|nr:hypothetical protein [Polyangiaceae bacterium]
MLRTFALTLLTTMSLAACGSDTRPLDFNPRNGVGATTTSGSQQYGTVIQSASGGNTSANSEGTSSGIPTNIGGNTSANSEGISSGIPTNIGGNTSANSNATTWHTGGDTSRTTAADATGGYPSGGAACQLPTRIAGCVPTTSPSTGWMFVFNPATNRCERVRRDECAAGAFAELQACINQCDPGGLTRCSQSADCVPRDLGCCASCEPHSKADFTAVNTRYTEVNTCAEDVACGPCQTFTGALTAPSFSATCVVGECQIFDVREQPESACTVDTDCRLRRGLDCCEDCSAEPWVAVNVNAAVGQDRCTASSNCAPCASLPPRNLVPQCVAGHCAVITII